MRMLRWIGFGLAVALLALAVASGLRQHRSVDEAPPPAAGPEPAADRLASAAPAPVDPA